MDANNSNGLDLHVPASAVRKFYAVLFTVGGLLILATALSDLRFRIVDNLIGTQLDLKLEGNFAVWYSSTVLLMAGVGAFAVGRRTPRGPQLNSWRHLWTAGAFFFLGISIDETAQLHEHTGGLFTKHFGRIPLLTDGGSGIFAWLLVLLPLIVVFFVVMLTIARCWLGLYPRSRTLVLSALACWAGVLLAELVQAQLVRRALERSVQGVLEEGLELIGATLFLIAFIEFLRAEARAASAP